MKLVPAVHRSLCTITAGRINQYRETSHNLQISYGWFLLLLPVGPPFMIDSIIIWIRWNSSILFFRCSL
ncbi:hypothetical protein SCACP_29430 [Sporomusa carbonis]